MQADVFPALVLNADFRPLCEFPLSLVPWQAAIGDVVRDRVAVVAEYDAWVRSPSTQMRLPSVVALRTYRPLTRRVAFTRFNVFLRDRFTCQYCGDKYCGDKYCGDRLPASKLTFDHVVPRSRGGKTTWTNVVTACGPCNTRKGDQLTPLPRRPAKQPTPRELLAARRAFPPNHLHTSWLDYLYWDVELEA